MTEIINCLWVKSRKLYKLLKLTLLFLSISGDSSKNIWLLKEMFNKLNLHIYYPFLYKKVGLSDRFKINTVVQQMFYPF